VDSNGVVLGFILSTLDPIEARCNQSVEAAYHTQKLAAIFL
jgi:hypothetical protein